MKTLFLRVKSWYWSLPWYWKIVGCLILIIMALLFILSLWSKSGEEKQALEALIEIDKLEEKQVRKKLEDLQEKDTVIHKEIIKKKKEIAVKINQAGAVDQKGLEQREKINKASTMEELDALQEELEL